MFQLNFASSLQRRMQSPQITRSEVAIMVSKKREIVKQKMQQIIDLFNEFDDNVAIARDHISDWEAYFSQREEELLDLCPF